MATYRNPILVIVFSVITCGIYYLYWLWVTNAEINRICGNESVGGGTVIISYFCGLVGWYIWYKWDISLQEVTQDRRVVYNSNFLLWLILSVIAGAGAFVMMFQVQDTLNRLNQQSAA